MKGKKSNPSVQRLRAALKALSATPITVPHVLADFAGGLEAGSVVAGLLFWCDKGAREDGFFWKSYGEWWQERRVREHTVRRVTRELAARGLIEIKLMRANGAPTLHYRVTDALVEEVGRFIESEESQNGFCEIKESDSAKPQNPSFENEESITAVTTAVYTADDGSAHAGKKEERPTAPRLTVLDALETVSREMRSPLNKRDLGDLSSKLLAAKLDPAAVLALWAECKARAHDPSGAFVYAIRHNGCVASLPTTPRPARSTPAAVPDRPGHIWVQGTGWVRRVGAAAS